MDSLSSGPIAEVLKRLHQEAEAADAPLAQTHEATSREQLITQFIDAETSDLTGLYHGLAGNFLNVSAEFGQFLYMCARGCKARRIVEFGSSMGVSTIYMATALRDMGGGRLIGTDLEASKAERAQANVAAAGLADLVEFRVGDARHLKPGALIIGENAFAEAPGYIDYVRDPQNGYLSLPLPFEAGRGNEFTVRTN